MATRINNDADLYHISEFQTHVPGYVASECGDRERKGKCFRGHVFYNMLNSIALLQCQLWSNFWFNVGPCG